MIHIVLTGSVEISNVIWTIMWQWVTSVYGYVVMVIEDWATFERLLSWWIKTSWKPVRRPELPAGSQLKPGLWRPTAKWARKNVCTCVCAYPCIHSCCRLMWRCLWWPLSWVCCRCQLEMERKNIISSINPEYNKRKTRSVKTHRRSRIHTVRLEFYLRRHLQPQVELFYAHT